jgi:hypothetical protein
MATQNTYPNNERILVYQRLTQKKDKILEVTCEIEDFRKKYLNQNQRDEDGSIESEIYKRIYMIIACLSELIGYTEGRSNALYRTLLNYSIFSRSSYGSRFSQEESPSNETNSGHIASSRVLDAICVAVNSVIITWSLKRDPIVKIEGLESIFQFLRLPGA